MLARYIDESPPPAAAGASREPIGLETRPPATHNRNRTIGLHLSAIIAGGAYAVGILANAVSAPAMIADLRRLSLGDIVLVSSFAVFMMAALTIQRQMGIPLSTSTTATPPLLCTHGAFKYSRNPIYLVFVLPLLALAYYSLLGSALSIAVYIAATTILVIRPEERALREEFGTQYEDYMRATPRWFIV